MNGLQVDKIFYSILKANTQIKTITSGRIFNPARTSEDETEDKVPYVIITFDGMRCESAVKDYPVGIEDVVQVSVMVCSDDREGLADLTMKVRQCLHDSLNSDNSVEQYDLVAGSVYFDFTKPCTYQTLTYTIVVSND